MAADFTWLFDALKLSTRFVLPVVLALAVFLFAPDSFIDHIGLTALRQQNQAYLGAAFVLSSCILASRGIIRGTAWARQQYRERVSLRASRARLHNLTPEEQALLRGYLERQTRSANLDIMSGVVSGLVSTDILYRSSNLGRTSTFAHNLQPWAWDYLNEHPELIGLTLAALESVRANPPEPKPSRACRG